jgi:hypothetical protein
MLKEFSSRVLGYSTIGELYEGLRVAADAGGCLLKGRLSKQISNEPRNGLTDASAPTDLLVIDYDSDAGFDSIQDMLGEIDALLPLTDYIFQHSASSGITGKPGLRGHVFILLEEPVAPQLLKQWLRKVNLLSARFRAKARLSRNAMALCYALDITANQNDKLIYIAPPVLESGMVNPVSTRWELVINESRAYKFSSAVSMELNRTKEDEHINDLQIAACLPRRKPRYKSVGETEILSNPAQCFLTSTKDCGAFTRVNINGGDSFAYWHFVDNPEILFNFKGEPAVYLKDILPGYHAQLMAKTKAVTIRPMVLRDVPTDTFYNLDYDEDNDLVISCYRARSKGTLIDYMVQRGAPPPRVIPDWHMEYTPTSLQTMDFTNRRFNTYKPSEYMRSFNRAGTGKSPVDFPVINKIISNICGDAPTYEHFINWVAHIVQFRTKTQTAWIFSGTEGTGKGLLFTAILKPLFGKESCFMITQSQTDEQFNDYLKNNMLLFLDEGDVETSRQAERMLANFRTLITEPYVPIRAMRANTELVRNYTNLIIATNKSMPVRITAGDRRYNIAPRQYRKLEITAEEVATIKDELQAFSEYLRDQEITPTQAFKVLESQARDDLLVLSCTVADEFFTALREGSLEFFTERLQETVPIPENGYINFSKVVTEWMRSSGSAITVTMDELVSVYRYISGNTDMTPKRFGHLAGRQNMSPGQVRINGIQRRVFEVQFEHRDYSEWLNRSTKPTLVNLGRA